MNEDILQFVRCPISHSTLSLASDALIERLNERIESGTLVTRIDRVVDEPLELGLVDAEQSVLYPVKNGIPTLIPDEAISIANVMSEPGSDS